MQTTDTVLMIEPIAFGYNAQTAENNYFQVEQKDSDIQQKALSEFNNFVEKLRSKGINVITIKDTLEPHSPDSIFPNNWVSFHKDGKVVLYPMFAPNRRVERREDILETIKNQGFEITEVDDFSHFENDDKFLEGTGSMIFDHENKIATVQCLFVWTRNFSKNSAQNMVLRLWFFILIKMQAIRDYLFIIPM